LQFQLFLDWLYFRRLPGGPYIDTEDHDDYDEEEEEEGEKEEDVDEETEEGECEHCGSGCPSMSFDDGLEKDKSSDLENLYPQFPLHSQEKEEELEAILLNLHCPNSRLYIFADRHDVPALRKAVIELLWYHHKANENQLPCWSTLVFTSTHLPISSSLSRLWVDLFIDRWCHNESANSPGCPIELAFRQKVPFEFLWAIMAGLSNKNHNIPGQGIKELCTYHEHPQDETSIKTCTRAKKDSRKRKRKTLDLEDKAELETTANKTAK
jgi:hypothetical protein